MYTPKASRDVRRVAPRVEVEAFCSEIVDGTERHGLLVDLSETGLRVTRPFAPGQIARSVQLEFEIPGVDEVIWAKGDVCFDRLRPATGSLGGLSGLVRTTGIRFAAAAARDLRLLRDYVFETKRRQDAIDDVSFFLSSATSYSLG